MARAPANCHQQNLGNLLAVVPFPICCLQIATQKHHGPCQLSGAESGKAIYKILQSHHTFSGKPTKCPVEILPMSHIHSGKTASGTTWVHMESSKGKSVGLISWLMCLDLIVDFSLPFGSGKWLLGLSLAQGTQELTQENAKHEAKQCKTWHYDTTVYQIHILKTWNICRKSAACFTCSENSE